MVKVKRTCMNVDLNKNGKYYRFSTVKAISLTAKAVLRFNKKILEEL